MKYYVQYRLTSETEWQQSLVPHDTYAEASAYADELAHERVNLVFRIVTMTVVTEEVNRE